MKEEEGGISSCFVKDLGLPLVAKMCPNRPQVFNNGQGVPVGRNHLFTFFFSKRTDYKSKASLLKCSR